ncbi:3-oxoacyl-[acyl-carrier-protein] reductase [Verrucomicrobium sp. GAS474]|uniref:3-oxoacyl-[acyl-carrier-protein] reductase n=1 Tax=Verrucomicrobium sp. GAS474 TaxID=1882831 RepID=UPI0008795BE4|nr:3-oxoacyl-[acyl-carrier-protein] reductase [Verrucomicrobium sp. GAS474]SDU19287.1 3-oxoacyl-[acyl-carrier-protein] reductase [Verrucomicrobium sp. GAS474]
MPLTNKNAIVTGASRGIGKAIALKLAEQGANVACVARSLESVQETVAAVEALGRKAKGFAVDVADYKSVEAAGKEIEDFFDTFDILVNNAGLTRDTLLMRMSPDDWDIVLQTNLKGAFNWTKAVTRQMLRQRSGRIINISSVIGLVGNAGQANYAASKAGLIGFTKSIAREFASRGVTANAVCPGFIETDMTQGLPQEIKEKALQQVPLGRMGRPEEIAAAVAFLAGPQADYITGQALVVDGGMVM